MYRYHRLLVGLDLSDHDDTLVHYTGLVSRMAHSDAVRFVHVYRPAPVFSEVYPEYYSPLDDTAGQLREDLSTLIDYNFEGPSHADVRCELVEGSPLAEMLRAAKDGDTDLVVVGKDERGGTLAEKLARKAPCSVLVVPPEARPDIRRVLVPVDFSRHAADAVDVAVAFAEAAGLDELHLLHVYAVPTGYYKLGKTYDEARASMRRFAEERYAAFVETLDLRGLKPIPHLVEGENAPQTVCEEAEKLEADLLMVGTRGRTASAAVLLGSVAEKMVRQANLPVVVVKRKGATLTLLDALFEL